MMADGILDFDSNFSTITMITFSLVSSFALMLSYLYCFSGDWADKSTGSCTPTW